MNLHRLYDIIGATVIVCSSLHTFLPPIEFLNDFPKAQKIYKVFIFVVGYIAINARSTVYRQISTDWGSKPSEVGK